MGSGKGGDTEIVARSLEKFEPGNAVIVAEILWMPSILVETVFLAICFALQPAGSEVGAVIRTYDTDGRLAEATGRIRAMLPERRRAIAGLFQDQC